MTMLEAVSLATGRLANFQIGKRRKLHLYDLRSNCPVCGARDLQAMTTDVFLRDTWGKSVVAICGECRACKTSFSLDRVPVLTTLGRRVVRLLVGAELDKNKARSMLKAATPAAPRVRKARAPRPVPDVGAELARIGSALEDLG